MCLLIGLDSLDIATSGSRMSYCLLALSGRNLNYLNYFLFVGFLVGMMISNGYALSKLYCLIIGLDSLDIASLRAGGMSKKEDYANKIMLVT
jgi:uncharacterized membrane protein